MVQGARRKRSARSTLRVRIGTEDIPGKDASAIFCEALRHMGLAQVAGLNHQLCGMPLVSKIRPIGRRQFKLIEGWYVVTHCSTPVKASMLHEIAKRLKCAMFIDVKSKAEIDQEFFESL